MDHLTLIKNFFWVALGGSLGSMLRYTLTLLAATYSISNLIGTMMANIFGSFLIGIVMAFCSGNSLYLFGAVGLCGGFTTFSTFSAQTLELMQSGQITLAISYALASVIACVLFVMLGIYLGGLLK